MKFLISVWVILAVISPKRLTSQDLSSMDGNIEEAAALKSIFSSDEFELFLEEIGDNYFRISVKGSALHVASLCLATGDDKVIVLHASAALGALEFRNENGSFRRNQKFSWGLRENDMSPTSVQKRLDYLNEYCWVATTMAMGREGETEFLISSEWLGSKSILLAAGLMTAEDPEHIVSMPTGLNEGCASLSLVSGDPLSNYPFRPEHWIKIDLK